MAEIRTTSSTGGQKGVKLERHDLIPIGPLKALAEHFGVGASKYADNQWRQGYEWSKSYAALQRHLTAFWAGLDYDVCSNDPDGCQHVDLDGNPFVAPREDACFNHTGSHHLAAVAWHAFALLEFVAEHPEHDDRFTSERQVDYDDVADAILANQPPPGEGPRVEDLTQGPTEELLAKNQIAVSRRQFESHYFPPKLPLAPEDFLDDRRPPSAGALVGRVAPEVESEAARRAKRSEGMVVQQIFVTEGPARDLIQEEMELRLAQMRHHGRGWPKS